MLNKPVNPSSSENSVDRALAELSKLRRFHGTPGEFWPAFLSAASTVAGASKSLLVLRDPANQANWKKLGDWSANGHTDRAILTFNRQVVEIAERCGKEGNIVHLVENTAAPNLNHYAVAVRLQLNRPDDLCIAVFLLLNATEAQAQEALVRLQLVSDTPASYLVSNTAGQAKADVEKFAISLDLLVLVNAEKKFLAATLAMCNAVATRFNSDRVSLGWIENGYIRLRSISRTERFDRQMAAVKALEVAMEESFDQNDEIIFPAPDHSPVVSRDHEIFAREQSVKHICSLPIRVDGKPVGVLTCERQTKAFTAMEVQQLRLSCDQASRRLADLKRTEGWLGKRMMTYTREKLSGVLGPEHTWAKVFALGSVILLAVLAFVPVTYRVEGTFLLRSDDISFLTSPFDGYIKDVKARPGDHLQAGASLLVLETDDLLLEKAAALADHTRFKREAEKARATGNLADMRISNSQAEQTEARIALIDYRLDRSTIKTPFDGIVIEGNLRERIGAPVKQGDALFKVARMESLYVEAEINQRDVHELLKASGGEIAFVTQPKLKFPVQLERIEPAAFPKDGENVFVARFKITPPSGAALNTAGAGGANAFPPAWWRPGMSGLVKVDAGQRTLLWILTHRTVDFLRLQLWW